jgi:hypothetical protein
MKNLISKGRSSGWRYGFESLLLGGDAVGGVDLVEADLVLHGHAIGLSVGASQGQEHPVVVGTIGDGSDGEESCCVARGLTCRTGRGNCKLSRSAFVGMMSGSEKIKPSCMRVGMQMFSERRRQWRRSTLLA